MSALEYINLSFTFRSEPCRYIKLTHTARTVERQRQTRICRFTFTEGVSSVCAVITYCKREQGLTSTPFKCTYKWIKSTTWYFFVKKKKEPALLWYQCVPSLCAFVLSITTGDVRASRALSSAGLACSHRAINILAKLTSLSRFLGS